MRFDGGQQALLFVALALVIIALGLCLALFVGSDSTARMTAIWQGSCAGVAFVFLLGALIMGVAAIDSGSTHADVVSLYRSLGKQGFHIVTSDVVDEKVVLSEGGCHIKLPVSQHPDHWSVQVRRDHGSVTVHPRQVAAMCRAARHG